MPLRILDDEPVGRPDPLAVTGQFADDGPRLDDATPHGEHMNTDGDIFSGQAVADTGTDIFGDAPVADETITFAPDPEPVVPVAVVEPEPIPEPVAVSVPVAAPVVETVVEAAPTGLMALPDLPVTDEEKECWYLLQDRLFDEGSTEVNVIANAPGSDTDYTVVSNVDTEYVVDDYFRVANEDTLNAVICRYILPNSTVALAPGEPLGAITDGTLFFRETFEDGDVAEVRARFQILTAPATYRTELHIAKLPKTDIDLEAMIGNGTMPADVAYFLGMATAAGANLTFSGIPGTGKTTVLNACSQEIPATEKVAVIQDVDELPLDHLLVKQKLFTYKGGDGSGSPSSLIEVVKRTRPQRLFTGECRSGEMYDHLEASSIFHGCMTTVHAANAEQALVNITNMAVKNPMAPGLSEVRELVATGVDLIVQMDVHRGRRIVTQVLEVTGGTTSDGVIRRNLLWAFDPASGQWVKGSTGPSERLRAKLGRAGKPDYWHTPPPM